MASFGWVAGRQHPPPQWNLRRVGWILASDPASGDVCLVDMRGRRFTQPRAEPARCILLGVTNGAERARLLEAGWGDVLAPDVGLAELAQRALRLGAAREMLPRRRQAGALALDLLYRDACAGQRWLALHPREFELLWRLAERSGERVSRARLLREVWRLGFDPGTNTVEVHVSRLRAKLAAAGVGGLVETDPAGGYRIAPSMDERLDQRLCA